MLLAEQTATLRSLLDREEIGMTRAIRCFVASNRGAGAKAAHQTRRKFPSLAPQHCDVIQRVVRRNSAPVRGAGGVPQPLARQVLT
jgi:hypothetical protein